MKTAFLLVLSVTLGFTGAAQSSEYGFLPGKKFPFYKSIITHDLKGAKIWIKLVDERKTLALETTSCSDLPLKNQTEFNGESGANAMRQYFSRLFTDAHAILDSAADEIINVELQALDARLLGFGNITAHGLCQIRITYQGQTQLICVDITDKDPHSPIGPKAWVTRKTAVRVILSAAIRESVEKVLNLVEGN